jgi:hypothetical protein
MQRRFHAAAVLLLMAGCNRGSNEQGPKKMSGAERKAALEAAYAPLDTQRDACLEAVGAAVGKRGEAAPTKVDAARLGAARPVRVPPKAHNQYDRPLPSNPSPPFKMVDAVELPDGMYAPGRACDIGVKPLVTAVKTVHVSKRRFEAALDAAKAAKPPPTPESVVLESEACERTGASKYKENVTSTTHVSVSGWRCEREYVWMDVTKGVVLARVLGKGTAQPGQRPARADIVALRKLDRGAYDKATEAAKAAALRQLKLLR